MDDVDDKRNNYSYGMDRWGGGYFGVNEKGHVVAKPAADGAEIDLAELALRLQREGFRLPVLVRFGDLLRRRANELIEAFAIARKRHAYPEPYRLIYPIKVNQERHVIREITRLGPEKLGLEAGSKPELLAVLGLGRRSSVIIFNGYKDREGLRYALAGMKMGYRVKVVIEKPGELDLLLDVAETMGVSPVLGVRLRLASVSMGKWQNSGGEKSKFGLGAVELMQFVQRLERAGHLDWLKMIHVHLGSQVANIRDIQRGMAETARFYGELRALGAPIEAVDVGGGLGVDYEGTRSRSDCSVNYNLEQYAEAVVYALQAVCRARQLPRPEIYSESGRALTAHHAVLITNVVETERVLPPEVVEPNSGSHSVLRELWNCLLHANELNPEEVYADGSYWIDEIQSLFRHGLVNLPERAAAEALQDALARTVAQRLNPEYTAQGQLLNSLRERLADRMFINLSIFQSLPDIWAINQVFPIAPLSRLNEAPTRRALLRDLTCDSDGRIDYYVGDSGLDTTLRVHESDGTPYFLGIFLVGAYQEILGDMHNLFGDTNAVNVVVDHNGYTLRDTRHGENAADLLRHVHIPPRALVRTWQRRLARCDLSDEEKADLHKLLESGLQTYTYLDR